MKITKYNQSCLLVETNGKRILFDPGNFGYNDSLLDEWTNIDYIFITHKHGDHCKDDAVNAIVNRDGTKVYTTKEVAESHNLNNPIIVKEKDVIDLGNIKVEVVKAIHGYLAPMKKSGGEILENVGYILDDGNKRLYTTSDTIGFNNDYKCDILCMPFNGNGLTMGIVDGILFAQDINPEIVLPIHTEHPWPFMNPDKEVLSKALDDANLKYKILELKETIEVE